MTTRSRVFGRTIATVVAVGLSAGVAGPALAASAPTQPSVVSVKAAQYPRLIDNPLDQNDVVRFTAVPGASWQLDGKDVTFVSGRSTADVKVTAASVATLAAVSGDTVTWQLADVSPTSWSFPAPTATATAAPDVNVAAVQAVWNDLPGTQRDTVTLPNVQGVTWTVTTGSTVVTYDADTFGAKTSVNVPVTKTSTVAAALVAGYQLPTGKALPSFTNTVTDTPEVAFTAAQLDALVSVGENPFDGAKGYGPGSAKESVKISGVPGLTWKVGSLPAKAVSGVGYLPVDPDDITNGKVTVKAVAARGYTVPAGYSTQVDFTDGTEPPTLVITDTDVKSADNGGTGNDTITLAPQQGMVWWVGQNDAKGRIVYTAQKPGKDGSVVYKVKHPTKAPATGGTEATVYLKPVPNRGYLLDTSTLLKTTYAFNRDDTKVPVGVAISGNRVDVTPNAGVVSWAVKYQLTVASKTTAKSLTINAADITRTDAKTMSVSLPTGATNVTATPKLAKSYVIG